MTSAQASALRDEVLRRLGRDDAAVAEVRRYCESPFGEPRVPSPVFPLPEEPHVADWRRYALESGAGAFDYLQQRLPQLAIPIGEGVSRTPAYADAVQRGKEFRSEDFGGRLRLERPEGVRLYIHEHPAGALPVLVLGHRGDFETLVRALAFRGEPKPIGPAVNAQLVAGFVNWDRMARHRQAWARGVDPAAVERVWPAEVARVAASERWRFQDRFMITCERPYSGVSAAELGLELGEAEWLQLSTRLRVEHEFTHYATQRVFGAMSLNLLDETLSDFMGTSYALGGFRAEWFLRFLGLERWPQVRAEGRVHTYAGQLSAPAFELLCAVTVDAAAGLERLAREFYSAAERGRFLLALAGMTLELLACDEAGALFGEAYDRAGRLTAPRS